MRDFKIEGDYAVFFDVPEYIEMKQADIKILKEKIWKQNNCKCPVLNKEIPLDKMVLDHNVLDFV
jgi:hypothetical protein